MISLYNLLGIILIFLSVILIFLFPLLYFLPKWNRDSNFVKVAKEINKFKPKAFISYQVEDFTIASIMQDRLTSNNINVVMFDRNRLWIDPIYEVLSSIAESAIFVVVDTCRPKSPWLDFEIYCAKKLGLNVRHIGSEIDNSFVSSIVKDVKFKVNYICWRCRSRRYFSADFMAKALDFSNEIRQRGIAIDYVNSTDMNKYNWWDSCGNPSSSSADGRFGAGFEYDGMPPEWWKWAPPANFLYFCIILGFWFSLVGLILLSLGIFLFCI